jgi:hypothetical protein
MHENTSRPAEAAMAVRFRRRARGVAGTLSTRCRSAARTPT